MEPHVRNYFKAFGYDESDSIACEFCGSHHSVEIHHVESRSKFGTKTKEQQDQPSNLIALCRWHHNLAHGPESREWRERFKDIISKRNGPTTERL